MDSSSKSSLPKAECLIMGGLFAGSMVLCIQASSAWGWMGGIGAWCAGEALRKSKSLTYDQVVKGSFDWAQDAVGEVGAIASPATRYLETQKNAGGKYVTPSIAEKLAESFVASQGLTTDWFNGFERRSAVLCGESGDGKTFLLNWRVQRFLEAHPEGELYICDPDYGSAHEGAEPNTWMGLPVGPVVQIDNVDIFNTICQVSDTVKAGAPKPSFRPLLLVIDEWVSFWDSLDDEDQQDIVLKALTNIINRGLKQGGVTFVLGLHDLAVGSSGLPQSLLRKVEVLLLWRAAQSERNYNNLDVQKRQRDETIARLSTLPKVVRGLRPCAVFTDKTLSVRALPELQMNPVQYIAPDAPIDPDQQWVDELWTHELEARLSMRMAERVSQGKSAVAWTDFWVNVAGQPSKDQASANPRYQIFKRRVDELAAKLKPENSDPPISGGGRCLDAPPGLEVSDT